MNHHPHAIGPNPAPPEDDDGPPELNDCLPCSCSGHAIHHKAKDDADVSHLRCSRSKSCRYIPIMEGRTIAEAAKLWNAEINAEQ